jgi:cytoskeletal protein CcmA (bactofilin family)
MSWGWFDRKRQDPAEWTGFLEQGVKVEGKVESTGTFRIDSAMKGTLVSEDTLILGEHAAIVGEILGNRVVIAGRFEGTIHARGTVEVKPNAIVTGEIHTPCLVIEPGAIFDGQCHMLAPTETAKPVTIPIRSAAAAGQSSR